MTQDPTNSPTNTYHWDAEQRLTTIVQNGSTYVSNTYNALGQLVEQNFPGFNLKSDTLFDASR